MVDCPSDYSCRNNARCSEEDAPIFSFLTRVSIVPTSSVHAVVYKLVGPLVVSAHCPIENANFLKPQPISVISTMEGVHFL